MMSQMYQLPMLFSAGLPASPTASPEHAAVQPTLGTSGLQCFDWFASLGHDASLLRMLEEELVRACLTRSAVTWNLRATRCSRSYILLNTSERPTFDTDYSYWPTASASDNRAWKPSDTLHLTRNGTLRHLNPEGQQSVMRLSQVVLWATMAAQDAKNSSLPASQATRDTLPGNVLRSGSDGYLNPDWCELLMGFPPGWTSPDSRLTSDRRSTIMSRRGRSFVRARIIDRAFRHSATPSSPSRPNPSS